MSTNPALPRAAKRDTVVDVFRDRERAEAAVEQEERTVPVEVRREEVHVEKRDLPERPLRPGEEAFVEGTIRVPVRGEETVMRKEAVVTRDVVVRD